MKYNEAVSQIKNGDLGKASFIDKLLTSRLKGIIEQDKKKEKLALKIAIREGKLASRMAKKMQKEEEKARKSQKQKTVKEKINPDMPVTSKSTEEKFSTNSPKSVSSAAHVEALQQHNSYTRSTNTR